MRCEGWIGKGTAFSFGPMKWYQCKEKATIRVKVKQDGETQEFPACKECWQRCIDAEDIEVISAEPIKENKK